MKRRSRTRRVLKWVGTVLSALILIAFAFSQFWRVEWEGVTHWWWVVGGYVGYSRIPEGVRSDPFIQVGPDASRGLAIRTRERSLGGLTGMRRRGRALFVPLWMPLVAIAIPTAVWWRLDRSFILPDACQSCGYNLTGNVSGRCPECGTDIEREGKPA